MKANAYYVIMILGLLFISAMVSLYQRTKEFPNNRAWFSMLEAEQSNQEDVNHKTASSDSKDLHPSFILPERLLHRRNRLRRVCAEETSELTDDALRNEALETTQYFPEHHLLVCVTPKAGSTTWNMMLVNRYNRTELMNSKDHKMVEEYQPDWETYMSVIRSPEYLKVVMARNPYERVLSAYRNRIVPNGVCSTAQTYVPKILQHSRDTRLTNEDIFYENGTLKIIPSFREFMSYLVTQNPDDLNEHWKPVTMRCGMCRIDYDVVMLTETLSDDITYVMQESGLDQIVSLSMANEHHNREKNDTHQLLKQYYSTLTPQLVQKFIHIYRMDFKFFNYDPTTILQYISSEEDREDDKGVNKNDDDNDN